MIKNNHPNRTLHIEIIFIKKLNLKKKKKKKKKTKTIIMPNEMFKFNCLNLPHNFISATNSKSKQHFFFFFYQKLYNSIY